jgi:hypothetical protein
MSPSFWMQGTEHICPVALLTPYHASPLQTAIKQSKTGSCSFKAVQGLAHLSTCLSTHYTQGYFIPATGQHLHDTERVCNHLQPEGTERSVHQYPCTTLSGQRGCQWDCILKTEGLCVRLRR